jgi:hypothetical protein
MQVEKPLPRINWLVPLAVIGVVGILGLLMGMRGAPIVYTLFVGVSGGIFLLASRPLWMELPIDVPE